jgi:hypothetical protein
MTDFNNITHDEINSKIMIILCANEGIVFDQYNLYSKVLDKISSSNFVPTTFKYKFMLVLRNLMTINNNVKLIKENDVYNVVYNSDVVIPINTNYDSSWVNINDFNTYIVDSNLDSEFNHKDIESGNTLYHDVFSSNCYDTIKKVIKTHYVDYEIKNNFDKTPIECINDIKVATLVISDLNSRINLLEMRLEKLELTDFFDEYSIYDFLKLKFAKFIKNNFCNLVIIFLSFLTIIIFRFI